MVSLIKDKDMVFFESILVWNYVMSFWNIVSGSCVIFFSIYSLYITYNIKYQDNYTRISTLLILIGVVAMLFHGTLYYVDLPMILLTNEYIKILLSLKTTMECVNVTHQNYLSNIALYSYRVLPVIIFSYFINHQLQIITFHLILKISEGSVLFLLYKLSQNLNSVVYSKIYSQHEDLKYQRQISKKSHEITTLGLSYSNFSLLNRNKINKEHSYIKRSILLHVMQNKIKTYLNLRGELNKISSISIYIYAISILIWCLENMFYKYVQTYQLHHLLMSIVIYYLNRIIEIHANIEYFAFTTKLW